MKIAFLCATAPLTLLAVRWSKALTPAGTVPGLFEAMVIPMLVLAPFCWLCGAGFGSLARVAPPARLYLWECLGALAGGAFATFAAAGSIPALPLLCVCGAGVSLLAVRLGGAWAHAAALLVCVPLALASDRIDAVRPGFGGLRLVEQKEGRYGHLAMAEAGGAKTFFFNGVAVTTFPDRAAEEEAGLWPLLSHPDPGKVLALGVSALPGLAEALEHPVSEVVVVEADAEALDMVRRHLDADARRALDDPRVKLVADDPRAFLRKEGGFDVVLHMGSEPLNAAANRLFTKEFFSEVRSSLARGGVLGFSLPSSENYLSPETAFANASVLRSLAEVFGSERALVPGSRMMVLAGVSQDRLDPGRLGAVYRRRRIKNTTLVPPAFAYHLMPERRAALEQRLSGLAGTAVNQDLRPVACFHAWKLWLVRVVSPAHLLGLIAVAGLGLWGLVRLWKSRRSVFASWESGAVFCLGLSGICAEVVLLLAFQSVCGALYWKVGLLMASFMGGLAAGAVAGARSAGTRERSAVLLRVLLAVLGAAAAGLGAGLTGLAGLAPGAAELVFCGLLAGLGLLVGWAYPLACPAGPAEVYAADLWGSSLGAFLTGAFLVPLAGMRASLALAGCAAAAALLWPRRSR